MQRKPDYTEHYDIAFEELFIREGNKLSIDHVGETMMGILLRDLKQRAGTLGDVNKDGVVDLKDVLAIDKPYAKEFFWTEFWEKFDLGLLVKGRMAAKLLDISIVQGEWWGFCNAQRALRAVNRGTRARLVEDGIMGPLTRHALDHACEEQFLAAYRSEAAGRFRDIVENNPSKYGKYCAGWVNRAYDEPYGF